MRPCRSLPLAFTVMVLMATAPLLGACENIFEDIESLEFAADLDAGLDVDLVDGGDAGPPVSDGGDAGDSGDTGGDTGADADVGHDADVGPTEPVCERDIPLDPGRCNPAQMTGCSTTTECTIVFGPPPEVGCGSVTTGATEAGEPCGSASDCLPGLTCVTWNAEADARAKTCSKFCELETGIGCAEDEFCTRSIALIDVQMPGLGFCTPRCDPYDPEACGQARTCSIDYQYPLNTCLPEFRCVISALPGRPEGGSCDPAESTQMCQRGLVCLEEVCVKPCQSDDDCGEEQSCGDPATDFLLRYCQ